MHIHPYKYLKKERLWKGFIAFGKINFYIYKQQMHIAALSMPAKLLYLVLSQWFAGFLMMIPCKTRELLDFRHIYIKTAA